MAPRVEHELHHRRRSRNLGVLAALLLFVVLIIGITMAKIRLGDPMKGYDHGVGDLPPAAGARP